MSTRANIIIKERFGHELWFYRHSDGYPEGTLPTLKKFLRWVKEGRIRDNAEQAAGWLIIIGAEEYKDRHLNQNYPYGDNYIDYQGFIPSEPGPKEMFTWKVGAYEPAVGEHGDIEYLYTVDLDTKQITYKEV